MEIIKADSFMYDLTLDENNCMKMMIKLPNEDKTVEVKITEKDINRMAYVFKLNDRSK